MIDNKTAILYSQLKPYKTLVSSTCMFIAEALSKVNKPYLACSFGKDSSVMLDLVLKIKPDIRVRFASHPETNYLDNYNDVIGWWKKKGINYEEIFCEGGLVKVKHAQRNALDAMHEDWDSFLVGIRKQESFARRVSLSKYGKFHLLANGRTKISPLADWTEKEISVYMLENDLPVLNKYKHEGFSARTTSGIPRTHIEESLNSLKQRDIISYNLLCEIMPDAKNF